VGVLGVGFGANLALNWAARDPRVLTVVAIAPYNQPEQAFERMAKEQNSSISPPALQEALSLVAARLDIHWADWSGAAALRQITVPVLLVGGGNDNISSTDDLKALEQTAPPGSKSLLVADADHGGIGYWFHEIAEPIKAWFHGHLPELSAGQLDRNKTTAQ
jgi:pimeloyl-ACP methyl ester carboxylesterase